MESWQIGLIVVVVVGLGLIIFGAVRDRRLNARRRAEMLAPPARDIPHFSPDAPAPAYLSELRAHRPPVDATPTDLDPVERERLQEWTRSLAASVVHAGYATDEMVTDRPTGWTVLADSTVLLSDDDLRTVRELLPVLERVLATGRPLVVAAAGISQELIDMFTVNHIQRVITILPVVVPDAADRETIAIATGAKPISRADLQAGYVTADMLGDCGTWLSTAKQSFVL